MRGKALLCAPCLALMDDLLNRRIQRILEVGREDARLQGVEDIEDADADYGQSHCFHLMELRRILWGEPTCGAFDDYGSAGLEPKPLEQN
jgi:hypothetical protein